MHEIMLWKFFLELPNHVMGNHIRRGIAVITYKSKLWNFHSSEKFIRVTSFHYILLKFNLFQNWHSHSQYVSLLKFEFWNLDSAKKGY